MYSGRCTLKMRKRYVNLLTCILGIFMIGAFVTMAGTLAIAQEGSEHSSVIVQGGDYGSSAVHANAEGQDASSPDKEAATPGADASSSSDSGNRDAPQKLTAKLDDGTVVTVEAGADVLPSGTTVEARVVNSQTVIDAITAEVQRKGGTAETTVKAIDVTLRNADGSEVQPSGKVKVTFSKTGMRSDDVSVYHVTEVDGREAQADASSRLKVEQVDTTRAKADEQVFEAEHFSIYAVVGQDPRLKVTFYGKDKQTEIASVLVKRSNTQAETNKIVYDPGVGTLEDDEAFRGWTTEPNYTMDTPALTIDQIRQKAYEQASSATEDGGELKLYPMIHKIITIVYLDENEASVGSDAVEVPLGDTRATYTVDMAYTPASATQNFEGWKVKEGGSAIEGYASGAVYPNKTQVALKMDADVRQIVLSVNAPEGHWLVFDENGQDATYNAPQFVKSGDATKEPALEPKRAGYTFGGWYTDEDCTPGNEFHFGGTIADNTTIYAKWDHSDTADYTVVVWKQNVAGDGYDFSKYVMLSGDVESTIDTVVRSGSGNGAYAIINGSPERYTGFHLDHFDQNVTITPEGTAVLNVYYDRTQYTLTFRAPVYIYRPVYFDTGEQQYGLVNGQYVPISYDYWSGYWTYTDNQITYQYRGTRYRREETNRLQTVKTITALYQQDISQSFPIVGTDGTSYDGYVWTPQNSAVFTTGDVHSLETMPAENTTFRRRDYGSGHTNHLYYYTEVAPGETGDVSYDGKEYKQHLHLRIDSRSNIYSTKSEDFHDIAGFTRLASDPDYGSDDRVSLDWSNKYTIKFYYTRDTYRVQYLDGVYVDSNNIVLENVSHTVLKTTNPMAYGDDLSSYNAGGNNYYTPSSAHAGYSFAGWYLDEKCTRPYTFSTMPEGGVTVYAKWVKNRYRVFLHPNAGTDSTLDWGSDVPMTSLISYGDKVSLPTGVRKDYSFVGWYTDPECTQVFSADTALTDDTTTPYDKTVDKTDPMDKWGNGATTNADANSPWVTRKRDLYGKWRKNLTGAKGIGIIYDANGGSNAPSDTLLYLDNSTAVAQAASTAPGGKEFEYWVLQTWDDAQGKYVDTPTHAYPGEKFTVLKDNAHDVDNGDGTHTYTVRLRAEYAEKGSPAYTKVLFDANGGTMGDASGSTTIEHSLPVNGDVAFPNPNPTRDGYTFLGWSGEKLDDVDDPSTVADKVLDTSKKYAADDLSGYAWDEGKGENVLYAVWQPKVVRLTVRKELAGDQADLTKSFPFTVRVTHDGKTYEGVATLGDNSLADGDGQTAEFAELTAEDGSKYTLRYGDAVTVSETGEDGYSTACAVPDGSVSGGTQCVIGLKDTNVVAADQNATSYRSTVVFTNAKDNVVITGVKAAVGSGALPVVLGVGGAIAVAGVSVTRRRRDGWGE